MRLLLLRASEDMHPYMTFPAWYRADTALKSSLMSSVRLCGCSNSVTTSYSRVWQQDTAKAARPVWPFDWLVPTSVEQAFRAEHGTGTSPHHHGSPIFRWLCRRSYVIATHHHLYYLSVITPFVVGCAR